MSNKPHKLKHLKNKALRKFTQIDPNESEETQKIHNQKSSIKPVNHENSKERLRDFKKEGEEHYKKTKPHHSKRTTPGSVDPENPQIVTGHEIGDKDIKRVNLASSTKGQDQRRKAQRNHKKKAA